MRGALALNLFLLLHLLPLHLTPIEMLANFLGWLLLPTLPLLILALIRRDRRRAALWTFPALAFLYLFGGLFLPHSTSHSCADAAPNACRHLRVMTFNLYGARERERGAQLNYLRHCGADLIALQEVSRDMAPLLESELLDVYPYQILYSNGFAGTGLLSRYPLQDAHIAELTPGTFCAHATVEIEGQPITIASAHPPPPITSFNLRYVVRGRQEIEALLRLAIPGEPFLLLGDFNHSDQSWDYELLTRAGLTDAFRAGGWGFGATWPSRIRRVVPSLPLVRIDFLWHSAHFETVAAWVGPHVTSDHRPVVADLVFRPTIRP